MAPISIVDSHIHLYTESEQSTLTWLSPEHPLAGSHSITEYNANTGSPAHLEGYIFIEADRKNDDAKDWTHPLEELSFVRRIVTGSPKPEDGHAATDAKHLLAAIPWAPVNLGPKKLEEYLAKAEETAGPETWAKVKGFRYLIQDKPNGIALEDDFIAGLQVLGKRGFVFDLGIDQHRRGRIQLDQAVEMIDRAHEGVEEDQKVVFIINHLCKPDLTIVNQTDPSFVAWRTSMFTLSRCRRTYMKLSGCFEELPHWLKARPAEDIFEAILPWLAIIVAAFGPSRIMFGSNWPVCNVGVGEDAWKKWHRVVEMVCDLAGLSEDDQKMLWGGTAKKAYNIEA